MNSVIIADIMKGGNVIGLRADQRVGHAQTLLLKNKIHFLPVINDQQEVLGVVSAKDIIGANEQDYISKIMTEDVLTIPQYEKVEIAARMMRNHKIHHLVVTHEQKLIGVVSSFDLLKLVEGKRFVMRDAGTKSKNIKKRLSLEV